MMSRSEAEQFLRDQIWVASEYGMHVPKIVRDSEQHNSLREALDVLGLGYDSDFIGIYDRDRDRYCNFNVDKYQFRRAGIAVENLKTRDPNEEVPATPAKKARKTSTPH